MIVSIADEDLVAAHGHGTLHREELEHSERCGCFYCEAIYSPSEIVEWIQDRNVTRNATGETALCPRCGVDAVLGSASGYPVNVIFLKKCVSVGLNLMVGLASTVGDALAQALGMEWITVEHEQGGPDPALRYPGTTVLAFPLTMISRRIERKEEVVVIELFNGVCEHLRRMKNNPEYRGH